LRIKNFKKYPWFPGVCFGTPSLRNGTLDLGQIMHVAKEIAAAICQKKINRNA
jgi:UDP-glucose 6-dehydrogenase